MSSQEAEIESRPAQAKKFARPLLKWRKAGYCSTHLSSYLWWDRRMTVQVGLDK
jgi:hypothetical protein